MAFGKEVDRIGGEWVKSIFWLPKKNPFAVLYIYREFQPLRCSKNA